MKWTAGAGASIDVFASSSTRKSAPARRLLPLALFYRALGPGDEKHCPLGIRIGHRKSDHAGDTRLLKDPPDSVEDCRTPVRIPLNACAIAADRRATDSDAVRAHCPVSRTSKPFDDALQGRHRMTKAQCIDCIRSF